MAFKGILNDHSQKFAIIASEEPKMGVVGMGSYNVKSLTKVLNDKESQKEIVSALVDPCLPGEEEREDTELNGIADSLKKAFIAADPEIEMYYYKFDQTKNKYVKTIFDGELEDLMDYWDKSQKDSAHINTNLTFKTVIIDIRNSLEGCLVFEPEYNGKKFRKSRVFFRNANNYDDSREMVINGDPKIAAIPRRPTGAKYDFARTQHIQLSGIDNTNDDNKQYGHIGRYRKNSNNAEIADQSVVSKLRLSYNKGLGYFESGTQSVIARLLSDLPAPGLKDIDLDTPDGIKFSQMYDVEGKAFFGGFTTGFALPLTVHNGNPNTFGPNVIGNKDEYKKERIRVVNRANASFNAGDVVMCSLIDNEWIVQGFGGSPAELEQITFSVGKWSFIKMIANSDAYFRDNRWFTSNGDSAYNRFQREDVYSTIMREKFYYDLNSHYADNATLSLGGVNDIPLLAKLNHSVVYNVDDILADETVLDNLPSVEDPDFIPSRRYVQSTAFDQLGSHMGGNNSLGNIFGRTNRRVNPDTASSESFAEYATNVPLFWGPVFPEGFNSSRGRKILTNPKTFQANGVDGFFGASRLLDINSNSNANNRHKSEATYMFADQRDFALSQLPAEVGLNASPSGEYGYPIESISLLANKESENEENFPLVYKNYFLDSGRLSWLSEQDKKNTPIYDIKPNKSTELDFIPLSFAMAGNADKASTVRNYNGYNTFDMARSVLQEDLSNTPHLWGNMFERESEFTDHDFVAKEGRDITAAVIAEAGFTGGENLPWDKYIINQAFNQPDATPFYFSEGEKGSNTVGIIAARNTFSLSAGGTVTFETDFNIGVNGKSGSTLARSSFSLLAGGFQSNGGGVSYSIPQFGTRDTRTVAMGHTSLYVQVFDHWPEAQTIYDARYYSPLHFCAGTFETIAKSNSRGTPYTEEWNESLPASGYNTAGLANLDYTRNVDKEEHDIDFRVPTYGHPINTSVDNTIIPLGVKIDRYGSVEPRQALRKQDEWRVNTICRGMMVSSEGGFKYFRRTIGLDESSSVITASGTGFTVGDNIVLDESKSIKIIVTEIGEGGALRSFSLLDKGKDLFPVDFSTSVLLEGDDEKSFGYLASARPEEGNDATILFRNGIIYDRIEETDYAKQHGTVQNLTPSSQDGKEGPIIDRKSTNITINDPSSDDQYDAFYYHVNDVGHVDLFNTFGGGGPYGFVKQDSSTNNNYYVDQSQGLLQYVSLNINSS